VIRGHPLAKVPFQGVLISVTLHLATVALYTTMMSGQKQCSNWKSQKIFQTILPGKIGTIHITNCNDTQQKQDKTMAKIMLVYAILKEIL
jgi:hypothetical protein